MIQPQKIIEQLRARWSQFADFDHSWRDEAREYEAALGRMAGLEAEEVLARIGSEATPGAIPTAEMDLAKDFRLPFARAFRDHGEARAWAFETLLGRSTLAVDGSQIPPPTEFNIPIGAVQAAWFENPHTPEGRYIKDLVFEILTPADLLIETGEDRIYSEQKINLRRFELEIGTLCRRLEDLAGRTEANRRPVALVDSSLVISFADRLQGEMRSRHIKAMLALLHCSERTRIPIVGYIDGSRARDLVHLLRFCFELPEAIRINDAQLLSARLDWGARTPLMICARGGADRKQAGVLDSFEEYRRGIGFVYLKTAASAPPARLEIPLWVWREGLLDEVIDVVRAEVVVGNGYPYAIQAADAAAAIGARDREQFYAIFQRFAEEQGVKLTVSQKAASKARRR